MKLDIMRLITLLCLSAALFACNHEAKDTTLMDQDLSGTWLFTRYDAIYDTNTDAYIATEIYNQRLVISDSNLGVLYYECWDVAGVGQSASKTDTHLYIDGNATAFASISTGVLETETESLASPNPGQTIERYKRLEKLTSSVDVDKGLLVLSGPITVSETDTVCVSHQYNDVNDIHIYDLNVPYDNDYLYMRMEIHAGPTTGLHNYTRFVSGADIYYFDILSTSANFWSVVGSNILAPTTATINITESTDSNIAGTFSFVGQDAGNYSGEFSMDTTP